MSNSHPEYIVQVSWLQSVFSSKHVCHTNGYPDDAHGTILEAGGSLWVLSLYYDRVPEQRFCWLLVIKEYSRLTLTPFQISATSSVLTGKETLLPQTLAKFSNFPHLGVRDSMSIPGCLHNFLFSFSPLLWRAILGPQGCCRSTLPPNTNCSSGPCTCTWTMLMWFSTW